jgi:hypothetical protein
MARWPTAKRRHGLGALDQLQRVDGKGRGFYGLHGMGMNL